MKLAYVCMDAGVPVFGRKGCSIHCQEILREFQRRGYDVDLIVDRLGDDVPDDLKSIRSVFDCPDLPKDRGARELAMVELNANVRELVSSKDYDLVYERYSLWSYAAMECAKERDIPSILEVNAPLLHEQEKYRGLLNRSLAEAVSKSCLDAARSVVCVSNGVANAIDVDPAKRFVVPNGVNIETIVPNESKGRAENAPFTVGFVGTLKPWHGVANLLAAFAKVYKQTQNSRLKIVGDGPEREKLEQTIETDFPNLTSAIDWTGAVPSKEIPRLLQSMDVAVAPYPKLDSFYFSPLKIFEYMAAGLPVVASRIGQIPNIVAHGANGLLVSPDSIDELAEAILTLANDPKRGRDMGLAARSYVEQNCSWEIVVDKILATLKQVPVSEGAVRGA